MRIPVLLAALAVLLAAPASRAETEADQLWQRVTAAYDALGTYSDSGEIVTEYGSGTAVQIREQHRFKTALKRPRQFYFEFDEDPDAGADRFVLWCEGAEFNTWWLTTKVHEVYPKGKGIDAFAVASLPTKGTAVLVPGLLFGSAGLKGPLHSLEELRLDGSGRIGGRDHVKLSGIVREKYGTSYVSSEYPATLWIDSESLLIRRILLDTPPGGGINRSTTTFDPVADPAVDDALFRFSPP
jgi:outer membrane lipoprotein-sorting protein